MMRSYLYHCGSGCCSKPPVTQLCQAQSSFSTYTHCVQATQPHTCTYAYTYTHTITKFLLHSLYNYCWVDSGQFLLLKHSSYCFILIVLLATAVIGFVNRVLYHLLSCLLIMFICMMYAIRKINYLHTNTYTHTHTHIHTQTHTLHTMHTHS